MVDQRRHYMRIFLLAIAVIFITSDHPLADGQYQETTQLTTDEGIRHGRSSMDSTKEDESIQLELSDTRPQIMRYDHLKAGLALVKSIDISRHDSDADHSIHHTNNEEANLSNRRLVAYDLDPILPPYTNKNVMDQLVLFFDNEDVNTSEMVEPDSENSGVVAANDGQDESIDNIPSDMENSKADDLESNDESLESTTIDTTEKLQESSDEVVLAESSTDEVSHKDEINEEMIDQKTSSHEISDMIINEDNTTNHILSREEGHSLPDSDVEDITENNIDGDHTIEDTNITAPNISIGDDSSSLNETTDSLHSDTLTSHDDESRDEMVNNLSDHPTPLEEEDHISLSEAADTQRSDKTIASAGNEEAESTNVTEESVVEMTYDPDTSMTDHLQKEQESSESNVTDVELQQEEESTYNAIEDESNKGDIDNISDTHKDQQTSTIKSTDENVSTKEDDEADDMKQIEEKENTLLETIEVSEAMTDKDMNSDELIEEDTTLETFQTHDILSGGGTIHALQDEIEENHDEELGGDLHVNMASDPSLLEESTIADASENVETPLHDQYESDSVIDDTDSTFGEGTTHEFASNSDDESIPSMNEQEDSSVDSSQDGETSATSIDTSIPPSDAPEVDEESQDSGEDDLSTDYEIDHQSINDQFIAGLDDLDKFLEEVDPPDELDIGASGLSIQDVIMGQGALIVKTRLKKGADYVKKSITGLRNRAKKQIKIVQEDDDSVNVNEITDVMGQNLKKSIDHAVTVFEESSHQLNRFRKYFFRIFRTLTSNIRDFFDDYGPTSYDAGEDEDGYITFDQLKFEDNDLADIRRKVMDTKSDRLSNDYMSKLRDQTMPIRGL